VTLFLSGALVVITRGDAALNVSRGVLECSCHKRSMRHSESATLPGGSGNSADDALVPSARQVVHDSMRFHVQDFIQQDTENIDRMGAESVDAMRDMLRERAPPHMHSMINSLGINELKDMLKKTGPSSGPPTADEQDQDRVSKLCAGKGGEIALAAWKVRTVLLNFATQPCVERALAADASYLQCTKDGHVLSKTAIAEGLFMHGLRPGLWLP
jgi:hypothetical protein